MSGLVLQPIPHAEGIAFLQDKPAVTRRVFDQLIPELKGLAFTVTGIESIDVLQNTRDLLAGIPQGRRWEDVRKDIVGEISPWITDPNAEPDDLEAHQRAGERRADLLMRLHGFQAYEVAHSKVLEQMGDVFSHWRWQTMGDGKVRAAHAAMNGITLPKDNRFWRTVWPNRGWNCRCMIVGITQEEAEPEIEAEQGMDPEKRKYPEGPALVQLEHGILNRGLSEQYNLLAEPGPHRVFGSLRPSVEELKSRYEPDVWSEFEAFAKNQNVSQGKTVWTWLNETHAGVPGSGSPAPGSNAAAAAVRSVAAIHDGLSALEPQIAAQDQHSQAAFAKAMRLLQAGAPDAEYAAAYAEYQRAAAHAAALRAAARELVSIPAGERGQVTVGTKLKGARKKQVAAGLDIVTAYTHADHLPAVAVKFHQKSRAYHLGSSIFISDQTSASVIAHEVTHATEQQAPAVLQASQDYLHKRARSGGRVLLKTLYPEVQWNSGEYTFEDEWIKKGGHAYIGKDYASRATEILTMGIERLHADPIAFFKHDPDYFRFVLQTLQKLT